MKFSVLMSIYDGESADYLKDCLESIARQSLQPDEVIIVEDGPIHQRLVDVLSEYKARLPIVLVPLEQNSGLGIALDIGLRRCKNDLVARMDTDDVCVLNRFELQVGFMNAHPLVDVLGGSIAEFTDCPDAPCAIRTLPLSARDVKKFAQSRCPVNHMTVMFRRSVILKAGSYQCFPGMEDYYLWARVLCGGGKISNVEDVLVYARIGNGMVGRRRGWAYFAREVQLQRRLCEMGLISSKRMLANVILRAPIRLMPAKFLAMVYKSLLRESPP